MTLCFKNLVIFAYLVGENCILVLFRSVSHIMCDKKYVFKLEFFIL